MLFTALVFGVFSSCTSDEVTKVFSRLSIDNADENGLLMCKVTSKAESKTVFFAPSTNWKTYVLKDEYWISDARKIGVDVNVWTVDDSAMMSDYIVQGVTYITTNKPDVLKCLISKLFVSKN